MTDVSDRDGANRRGEAFAYDQADWKPLRNSLLASLNDQDTKIIQAHCETSYLGAGSIVAYGRGADDVLFPSQGFFSVLVNIGRQEVEMNLVGCEGMVGVPGVLGLNLGRYRAIARQDTEVARIPTQDLRRLVSANPKIAAMVLTFVRSVVSQLLGRVSAHAHLTLSQRVAYWLVQACERADERPLQVGHSALAVAMGADRTAISRALRQLGQAGVVRLEGRRITVLDRSKLFAILGDEAGPGGIGCRLPHAGGFA